MKCPECGLTDNASDHVSYQEYVWYEGMFLLHCIECGCHWRPSTGKIIEVKT